MIGLIRSELLKIRTTNAWWLFGIGLVAMTGLSLLVNCVQAHYYLTEPAPDTTGMSADDAASTQAQWLAQSQIVAQAANVFTSGQFFGGLFVVLLGMLVVTNEFYHQTATATFLTTPSRPAVVAAKMIAGVGFGALFWLITTILSLITGVIYFQTEHISNSLGDWEVQRAILFNLMVFGLWAIVGVGFGALIRNQVGAVVTGALTYVVGSQLATIVFFLIRRFVFKTDAVYAWQVMIPNVAANVFVSPVDVFQNSPPYWVGGLVLLGYGGIATVIGTWIMRIRDIS